MLKFTVEIEEKELEDGGSDIFFGYNFDEKTATDIEKMIGTCYADAFFKSTDQLKADIEENKGKSSLTLIKKIGKYLKK